MKFESDQAKSERHRLQRRLAFELSILLFESPALERVDERQDDGEVRVQAIGIAGGRVLLCVCTDRGPIRRIISLRYANRRECDACRATFPS
ncbi:MAG TPA: BrnT family toxin [Acetobacteraceae bacterium]|nr:BrnT family toxin [Acetobacteraceae bacterium]